MRSKGREQNPVSLLVLVFCLVMTTALFAGVVSADSSLDNATQELSLTSSDPDLIVSVESYDPITGDLWVAVSSDPETLHNIFNSLQVTITIDGTEVDSHIESTIEEHYYYPVPLSTLPEGDHEVEVTIDYSWKAGKVDPDTSNNVATQSFVVGPQAVQNDFGLVNCQVTVTDGVPTLTGDVISDSSEGYVITVNVDGSKFTEVSGSGAGAFTPQILTGAVGDHTVDLSIAPADSGVIDPNSGNNAVTGLSYTILAPVPTQDLAVSDIDFPGSGNILVVVDKVGGGVINSATVSLEINGITKIQGIPDGSTSPYRASFSPDEFGLVFGQGYLAVGGAGSTILDPDETNNVHKEEISVNPAPIPTQDAQFEDGAICEGTTVKAKIIGLSGLIADQTVKVNAWLGDDGPKHEIGSYDISSVEFINVEADLLNIFAPEDLYGTHTLHLEVVAPFDTNADNNFAEVTCTYEKPEDPAPSFDMNLFKLEEVTPIQLKGTIKFEGGTLPESAAVYVNDMRIGDSFTDNGDGTFSFLVTPQRYASGTDFKISVLSFVAEENMDNNHQLWTAPSSAVVIEQANAYYCGGDTKVRSLTTVTGNTLSSAAYHISIYDKDGKCIVNDKVIGGPSKIPVGTAYRYMNIQKYVNDLDAGAYQAKLWVLDKSGLKSNVYEFEIKIQKPQSKNLALTFAKFQCGSFKMGVGAKDGGVVPSDTIFTVTINGKTKVYSAGSDLSECLSYKQLQKDFGLCAGKVYSFKVMASSKKVCEAKKLLVDNTKTGTFKFKK